MNNTEINKGNDFSLEGPINIELVKKPMLKWGEFLLFIFLYFVAFFLVEIFSVIYDVLVNGGPVIYKYLLIEAFILLIMLGLFKNVAKFIVPTFNFSVLKKFKTYGYLILGFLLFFAVQYIMINILKVDDSSNQAEYTGLTNIKNTWELIPFYLGLAIITPIKEEIIFRGLIHRFFETKYNFWLGLIISSVIFGSLHSGYQISAGIMGAVFVLLYKKTNSLVAPILLHMAWNLMVTILLTAS